MVQNIQLITQPNPFRSSTEVVFYLPKAGQVNLAVFHPNGSLVQQWYKAETLPAGEYRITFSGDKLSAGIYYLQLQTNEEQLVRKLVLLK